MSELTLQDVIDEVKYIKEIAGDYEVAHSAEDALYEAVLKHIANGGKNPAGYAKEALKTLDIEFSRHCA